jgi:hypothetical protein
VFPDQVFFTLNGVRINCVEEIDGLTILQFAEVAGSAFSEDGSFDTANLNQLGATAGQVVSLLRNAIVDSDWPLFEKTVKAPGSGVNSERLAEIMGWVIEQYMERPTE